MISAEEQRVINSLTSNWIWVPDWIDSRVENTAGRIVKFRRRIDLSSKPTRALVHCSADTRYKLVINGVRVAVGPSRSSPLIWYYDTIDVAPYLQVGQNEIEFIVLRYFASCRAAMSFERTSFPGLTVFGHVETNTGAIDLSTGADTDWRAQVEEGISFPMGLIDDVFLHINERVRPTVCASNIIPKPYNFKPLNGELAPWRLRPRSIPLPEESSVGINTVRACQSSTAAEEWKQFLSGNKSLKLSANSCHTVDIQADVHSTCFLKWVFKSVGPSQLKLKITYSEGYELEPRSYPFFRSKADRLDADRGQIVGPFDEVVLEIPEMQAITYEPFWFRTFRIMRLEINVGLEPIELQSFEAVQTNYPLAVKASWKNPRDAESKNIWDVSIRTMRNCMFDGYSDCPFYEQLQYCCDSRSVGLFHYLLSGDDRLMRQSITNFAASVTFEGLTQSRFPSQVKQIVAGFSLYWILAVCDHHLYFGDTAFAKSFLPRIDGVLDFFDRHVNDQGLVSGLPKDTWQYVDWVTTWGATDDHPDKGVPTSGRSSNLHTYFSLLYSYVLRQAARLVEDVGRPAYAHEYHSRASLLVDAVRKHCYDGRFFTDSTADIADDNSYSQHCQVFAVIAEAAPPDDCARLLKESFSSARHSKCSYMMKFYAFRAFAQAGDEVYESFWQHAWDPWRQMLANHLTTWEEDDVRQRSDCHAWGSVPIYEYCTELAGVQPLTPGCNKILFKPRLNLTDALEAKVVLGIDNLATVVWNKGKDGKILVELTLTEPVEVVSHLPGGKAEFRGIIDHLSLST